MSQVVIENPVLNSPFVDPNRHFRFGDEGITDEVVEESWIAATFTDESKLALTTADLPTKTQLDPIVGETSIHSLDDLRARRMNEAAKVSTASHALGPRHQQSRRLRSLGLPRSRRSVECKKGDWLNPG